MKSTTSKAAMVSLVCASAFAATVAAETVKQDDLEEARLFASQSISRFRDQIRPYLSLEERRIEQSIEYEVAPTWNMNAFARTDASGRRRIQVNAGHFRTLQWLSAAVVSPRWGGSPECVTAYVNHVIDGIYDNSRAIRVGAERRPVYEFFAFTSRRTECARFSPNAYSGDREGQLN